MILSTINEGRATRGFKVDGGDIWIWGSEIDLGPGGEDEVWDIRYVH